MFISYPMNDLAKWFKQKGSEGRKALFLRIKEVYPRFSQTSLSHYSKNQRTPSHEIAKIISEFIGVPLESIPYRYVNKPNGNQKPTKK